MPAPPGTGSAGSKVTPVTRSKPESMMRIVTLLQYVLVASTLVATSASQAQTQEPAKSGASIAGKAATSKTLPAKAVPERKRMELTAAAPAATPAQSASPVATSPAAAAAKEKSHCHSGGSDV